MDYMIWVWLVVFVVAVVLEASTQNFVSIWFAIGALVTLLICSFVEIWAEIIIFSVISLVTLIFTRPFVKKLMERSERFTNVDEFVGKRVKVEKTITKYENGEVKLNGIIYQALLMENETESIETGSVVEVVALNGNKAVVKLI